ALGVGPVLGAAELARDGAYLGVVADDRAHLRLDALRLVGRDRERERDVHEDVPLVEARQELAPEAAPEPERDRGGARGGGEDDRGPGQGELGGASVGPLEGEDEPVLPGTPTEEEHAELRDEGEREEEGPERRQADGPGERPEDPALDALEG